MFVCLPRPFIENVLVLLSHCRFNVWVDTKGNNILPLLLCFTAHRNPSKHRVDSNREIFLRGRKGLTPTRKGSKTENGGVSSLNIYHSTLQINFFICFSILLIEAVYSKNECFYLTEFTLFPTTETDILNKMLLISLIHLIFYYSKQMRTCIKFG